MFKINCYQNLVAIHILKAKGLKAEIGSILRMKILFPQVILALSKLELLTF